MESARRDGTITTIQSCDHHDESGSIPDNRSRVRMLEQFAAATSFAEAFRGMVLGSVLTIEVLSPRGLRERPTITIEADAFLRCWDAFMAWHAVQPRGDDLAPARVPPAEIRVPPAGDAAATAEDAAATSEGDVPPSEGEAAPAVS